MASSEMPSLSLRQGVRIIPPDNLAPAEEVLLAAGEQVGHENLLFASCMNKVVVVFLSDESRGHQLIGSGVFNRDTICPGVPAVRPFDADYRVQRPAVSPERGARK